MSKTKGTYDELWADHTVNDFIGCTNGCKYCYAMRMFLRLKKVESYEAFMCPRRSEGSLEREKKLDKGINPFLKKDGTKKYEGRVMYPSTHDITKENYEICIKTLVALAQAGNDILIVTKGETQTIQKVAFALRHWKKQIEFRITIGSKNDETLKKYEPNAPCFLDRYVLLKQLYYDGWETSVSIEPYLDDEVFELFYKIASFVTTRIFIGKMNPVGLFPELRLLYSEGALYMIYKKLMRMNPVLKAKIKWKDTTELMIKRIILDRLVIHGDEKNGT